MNVALMTSLIGLFLRSTLWIIKARTVSKRLSWCMRNCKTENLCITWKLKPIQAGILFSNTRDRSRVFSSFDQPAGNIQDLRPTHAI